MRRAWLVAVLALSCNAYELTGHIEPTGSLTVYLQCDTAPFQTSTVSDASGHFRFRGIQPDTYTLTISTAARGEVRQTIELTPGTVDSRGRLDILVRIDGGRLESDRPRTAGATVSTVFLSVPDRALKEYQEAQRCLSRRDSGCASTHLTRAIQIAPQFGAAWNQLGTIAYQTQRFSDAETNFRRALDADSEAFEPLVNLGGVLLNLGRPKEALDYNQRAAARRPNDALANSQLGLTYFLLNDLDQAEKYLKVAIRIDPAHFSRPQLALAEVYLRRGDRPAAIDALRGFLAQHPDAEVAPRIRREIAELSGQNEVR